MQHVRQQIQVIFVAVGLLCDCRPVPQIILPLGGKKFPLRRHFCRPVTLLNEAMDVCRAEILLGVIGPYVSNRKIRDVQPWKGTKLQFLPQKKIRGPPSQ